MRFGRVPLSEALGAILAHSVSTPGGRLRKGKVLDGDDLATLAAAGQTNPIVARLDAGDIEENAAAARLAAALCGDGLARRDAFTGRANLHAEGPGLLRIDRAAIAAVNAIDPMITVATLPEWQRMAPGTMAATVKIIAYGVSKRALSAACEAGAGALSRAVPALSKAELIVTTLDAAAEAPGVDAVVDRLRRLDVTVSTRQVPHDADALAAALADGHAPLRLILTASATSDPRDVGPTALGQAGGVLTRFGMPVDPGNLLFLGTLGADAVIGLPGCARSPALNGADWVLERIVCGVPVESADIAAMGVGGLLKEIPTRPQPRERRR
ncbi:molybdopterin-binding protein [Jannaschia sp. 2305UL9-9]|uniref:molybdopterin-binding protein n=1 Tax=Jannaschia sp. 2305UL9-9 TaxID=3121638 RepID=UPI00352751A9